MKFMILLAIVIGFIYYSYSNTKEAVQSKATEAAVAVSDYSNEQKEIFQKEMEGKLGDLEEEIVQLEKLNAQKSKNARNDIEQQLNLLENKRADLSHDLEKLKKSSGKAWIEMKGGVGKAWETLSVSFEKAKNEFKENK